MHSHRSENGLSRNNPARYTFLLSPVLYFFFMSEGRTTSVQTVEVIWVPKRTSFRVNGIKKLVTGSCSILKDFSRGKTRRTPFKYHPAFSAHSFPSCSAHMLLQLDFSLRKQAGDPGSAVQEIKLLLHRQVFFPLMSSAVLGASAQLRLCEMLCCAPMSSNSALLAHWPNDFPIRALIPAFPQVLVTCSCSLLSPLTSDINSLVSIVVKGNRTLRNWINNPMN